jgi:hypothetical protein
MRKLKTDIDGGFPFVLDDIRWLENGTADAITAFTSAFLGSQTALVLSGFDLTTVDVGGTLMLTATPGWIAYNGEVFYFEGYNGVLNLPALKFRIKSTFDPSGLKVFETTSPPSHNTYEVRTMELQLTPIDGLFGIVDLHTVNASIANMMTNHEVVKELLITNNVVAPFPSPGTYFLYGRKGFGNQKHLSGKLYTNGGLIDVLPAEYCPEETVSLICNTELTPVQISIQTGGAIIFNGYLDGSSPGYAVINMNATFY